MKTKQQRTPTLPKLRIEDILPQHLAIRKTFDLIEIAEEEIKKAQRKWPKARRRLWRSFMLLQPQDQRPGSSLHEVMGDRPVLYRSHCRIMLRRIALRKDTRPATAAEIVGVISVASLAAPPASSVTTLYARLFARLYPRKVESIYFDEEWRLALERVHGREADEVLEMLRKKLYVKDRA